MRPELYQVDAFTDEAFGGNPAAICLLDREPDEAWMRALAREMNLSETAFLAPAPADDDHESWTLRWFTPTVEVDLCGHATLAAAHVLFEHRHVEDEVLRFDTRSGVLSASRGPDGWIQLDFPSDHPTAVEPPGRLFDTLGIHDGTVAVQRGRNDYLIEVTSPELLRTLQPDFVVLRELPIRGVIVTSVGDGLYDVVSRFFAPGSGIDEDPVTGSAHTTLGPYWSPRLGKDELLCYQASDRGGVVRVTMRGDRVLLDGQAVTIGRIRLADAALPPTRSRRRSRA